MTLAISIVTRRLAFVAADRRYSGVASLNSFLANKVCRLETSDAQGLLTFAGVGARALKGQPFELGDWVTNVLRGHIRNLDQSLEVLRTAAVSQRLNSHASGHTFIFSGFKDKATPILRVVTALDQLQTIEFSKAETRTAHALAGDNFRTVNIEIGRRKVSTFVAGSGGPLLKVGDLRSLVRHILRAPTKEAEVQRLCALTTDVIRKVSSVESTVGPEVTCGWVFQEGGGVHATYDAQGKRDNNSGMLPSVAQGMPISDMMRLLGPLMMDHMSKFIEANEKGETVPPPDDVEMNRLLASIDYKPREKF